MSTLFRNIFFDFTKIFRQIGTKLDVSKIFIGQNVS